VDSEEINSVNADGVGGGWCHSDQVDLPDGWIVVELKRSDLDHEAAGAAGDSGPQQTDDGGLAWASVGQGRDGGTWGHGGRRGRAH